MKKIISNTYFTAYNDAENKINLIQWTNRILSLPTDDYKNGIINAFKSLNNFPADHLIIDNTNAIYPITETLQEWIIENIVPLNRHYKKIAYVYPKDFFTSMGIEQIVKKSDEIERQTQQRRKMFDNVDSAMEWILS